MPIYEFKCDSCSHIDEHLMKITDPAPEKCSLCGGKVHKIMSLSSFSLKGTGWYATDYKNPAPPPSSSSESKESVATETTQAAPTTPAPAETPASTSTTPSEPTK